MKDLILIGAGGTCADVLTIIEALNAKGAGYRCLGILDDNPALKGGGAFGLPLLGGLSDAGAWSNARLVDCLGSPGSYRRREGILRDRGLDMGRFETLISPHAIVASSAAVGSGCVIFPGVVVMSGVTLGAHVTILANCVLNHDVSVGDFSILTSGVNVSGRVRIGRSSYIGAGSSLKHDVSVGDGALVGLGSAVIRDVLPHTVVAGNPARLLHEQTKDSS